jgi:hypothetical protein
MKKINDKIARTLEDIYNHSSKTLDKPTFNKIMVEATEYSKWFSLKENRLVVNDPCDDAYEHIAAHKARTAMLWGWIDPNLFLNKIDAKTMNQVLDIRKHPFPYDSLEIKRHINCKTPKYNIVIPVKESDDSLTRTYHLRILCNYLMMYLRFRKDWAVTIVIQEDDNCMTDFILENLNKFKEQYGFENYNVFTVVKSDKFMKKSCCYNLACKEIESEWQINHDVDLVFTSKFIDGIENFCAANIGKFFQPYCGGKVTQLTADQTDLLALEPFLDREVSMSPVKAPGGSVVVKRDLMIEVGGYDPHIIEGYGPEDSMFWLKLELATLKPDVTGFSSPHIGGGYYSNHVETQVLHFLHPPGLIDIDSAFIPFAYYTFLTHGDPKKRTEFLNSIKGKL